MLKLFLYNYIVGYNAFVTTSVPQTVLIKDERNREKINNSII